MCAADHPIPFASWAFTRAFPRQIADGVPGNTGDVNIVSSYNSEMIELIEGSFAMKTCLRRLTMHLT